VARRAIAEVPLEDFNESMNIMIHSWPGQGKTVFGCSAPNATLVSAEPGSISAKRQGSKAGLVKIRTWEDCQDLVTAVENGEFAHREWMVIDTASTIQRKNMRSILDRAHAANPNRDEDIPAIQDYQKNQNSFQRWVERMVDAPINMVWLCHTMRVEDQNGDALYLPAIMGGPDKGFPIANYVMGLMNVVGYMETKTLPKTEDAPKRRVRRILWQPYDDPEKGVRYTAKDQFDCLGRWSDDQTMPDIIAKIEASGGSHVEEPKPARRTSRRAS
jgi:hypothetical protein